MNYPTIIKYAKEDKAYTVEFPDMPTVNTFGETLEEALAMAEEAMNLFLEFEFERGQEAPSVSRLTGKNVHQIPVEPHIALSYDLRKARGKRPQKEIAGMLGISYQVYQRFENPRKSNPTVKTLEKVAKVLGKRLVVNLA
jgi:antitoxin HicB